MMDRVVKINHLNETYINHSENDISFIGLNFDQKVQNISECRRKWLREGDFEFTDLIDRLSLKTNLDDQNFIDSTSSKMRTMWIGS